MSKRRPRDASRSPAARRAASPYATGGGGTLEARVGARYLALLLTGKTAPEVEDSRAIVRVRFQQAPRVPIDDLVIEAARPDELTPSLELGMEREYGEREQVLTSATL